MTRGGLTPEFLSSLDAEYLHIGFLFETEFASAPLRLWSGIGDYTWDTKIFYGNGWLQGWSGAGETEDVKAVSLTVSLAGIPSELVALALSQSRQNKPGNLWFVLLDDSEAPTTDPYLLFTGKLDTVEIADGTEDSRITLTYENELIELEKAEEWRMTDQSQKTLYPGDRGLEYVNDLADWNGFWGVPESTEKKKKTDKKKKNRKRRK